MNRIKNNEHMVPESPTAQITKKFHHKLKEQYTQKKSFHSNHVFLAIRFFQTKMSKFLLSFNTKYSFLKNILFTFSNCFTKEKGNRSKNHHKSIIKKKKKTTFVINRAKSVYLAYNTCLNHSWIGLIHILRKTITLWQAKDLEEVFRATV